jgi:DNA-binding NarL/FixJ family response regulator
LGTSQKLLAFDFDVSNATIASQCATALSAMAAGQTVSRAPVLLVLAAHAAQGVFLEPARVEAELEGSRRLLSCAIPGSTFADRLSRCELEVAQLLIVGKTHIEIAAERQTSPRTTANQLASIFGKLGVSGRGELRNIAINEASALFAARNTLTALPAPALERRPPARIEPEALTSIAV